VCTEAECVMVLYGGAGEAVLVAVAVLVAGTEGGQLVYGLTECESVTGLVAIGLETVHEQSRMVKVVASVTV